MKNKKKYLIYLLVTGLLVRLSIVYFQYSGDIGNHIAWGKGFLEGTLGFFSKKFPGYNDANYPPVTIYLFGFSVWLYQLASQLVISFNQAIRIFPSGLVHLMPTLNMQSAFMKLPCIFADLGIAWLIYQLAPTKKKNIKLLLASLFLFNPAVIYISTIWGQVESLPIFFILLSFYFLSLFAKKQKSKINVNTYYYLSHLSFAFAALSKQTALWILPIMLIVWFKKTNIVNFLKGLFIQLIAFVLLYLPFTLSLIEPFNIYLQTLSGSTTLAAESVWNIWHFLLPPHAQDSILFLGLSIRFWSLLSLAIVYSLVCLRLFLNFEKGDIYSSLFLLSLAAFFLQTRVHEKHLFPALVFLLLVGSHKKVNKYVFFIILSVYHMLDLYKSLQLPFI